MHVGLDFGTSNNAVSVYDTTTQAPRILPIGDQGKLLLPSALHIDDRARIGLCLLDYLSEDAAQAYRLQHQHSLNLARQRQHRESYTDPLRFGERAFSHYMDYPSEGYFIKSPKSFLGVSGLGDTQLSFFEDLCALFLGEIRRRAEKILGQRITSVTIGRPIHFLGAGEVDSNAQAIGIVRRAAARIGWERVQFCFEPNAAGYHFARSLPKTQTVLVADIGGGTSDFSLLRLSPSGDAEALAHSGTRTGGNDFDIALAIHQFMPHFGLGEQTRQGLPLPSALFPQAMSVNDVYAKRSFYQTRTRREITDLLRDCPADSAFHYFPSVWDEQRSFQIVRIAEQGKIHLSQQESVSNDIPGLPESIVLSTPNLADASQRVLATIGKQIPKVLANQPYPELIYTTGGTAQSVLIQTALQEWLPGVPIHSGHYLDGVASGLCLPHIPLVQ